MRKYSGALLFAIGLLLFAINLHASDERILAKGLGAPEGFADLSYQPSAKLIRAAFIHGATRITMEVRRGEPTPEVMLTNDPNAPPFSIDIRLLDQSGLPFFIQIGGGALIDPSWQYSESARNELGPEDKVLGSKRNFTAAKTMIQKIGLTRFKPALAPEYESIMNILPLIEGALVSEGIEGYDPDDSQETGCTDTHRIEIWTQPLMMFGEHSATLAKIISSGSTYQIWSACNHGTCPEGGLNISLSCAKSFVNRCFFSSGAPHCSSSYGFAPGQHVCNDDTYIQYERIKNDLEPDAIGGTCSDDFLRRYAPDCW